MSAYLFVHFKEKKTPDGEQVYFGLSRDGFNWEQVNGGKPGFMGAIKVTRVYGIIQSSVRSPVNFIFCLRTLAWRTASIPSMKVPGQILRGTEASVWHSGSRMIS